MLGQNRITAAPDERAKSGQQLAKIERLCEVIVRTAVESFDAGLDRGAGRYHQHRDGTARFADRTAHGEAIHARQHDIQDHDIVIGRADLDERTLTVASDVHGIRLLSEALGQHICGVRLVFDQKDTHGRCGGSIIAAAR
jgi:hypothetical protein